MEIDKNSFTETPYVLGHGGMGSNFKYPKDSERSFQQLIALGCEGSEIDVQMTKDSVLVLYHDETLETLTNGTGLVSNHNWAELKDLNYFSPFDGEMKILKLEELFQMTSGNPSFIFSLDIKFFGENSLKPSFYRIFSSQLKSMISRFHLENTAFIECKLEYPGFPEIIHEYFPSPNKVFITGFYDKEALLVEAEKFKSFGIGFSLNDANQNFIDKAHSKNMKVMLWDVYTKSDIKKLEKLSPEYIQSDLLFYSN
ncbi:MAG: glycerophosphodiester phosphodiesterase family protein [Bacteroidota bacterium]|nr:glycerophosphodiester phosphodiesterase family protein [Bacteroidota bacterium]